MGATLPSLKGQESSLAAPERQLHLLNRGTARLAELPRFGSQLAAAGLAPLRAAGVQVLQINVGKLCNQACKHCHVDAGPDRDEVMSREVFEHCLRALEAADIPTVDLTGGAPELNPHFRWFVERVSALGREVIVRCNLTVILANRRFHDLPEFFRAHRLHVISSLPYYEAGFTDRQRGPGVFEKSVAALKLLNGVGYGRPETGLKLDLVYNPAGAFLPAPQAALEADFKRELQARHGIVFNNLYTITNLPISRFLDYLERSGNLEEYLERLVEAYNPAAAQGVMCRTLVSVGWDGSLYDCDFNQMLDMQLAGGLPRHIRDFDAAALGRREIRVDQHCYGCTAGAGSSCGGTLT
jgi:radical SAM/Cys-rich protein